MTRSRFSLLVALGVSIATGACRSNTAGPGAAPPASPNVWATVGERQISRDEVEKAYRREAAPQQPSQEEALGGKLTLLNEMIVQELLLAKARELKIELSDTELDSAYADAKKNITEDQFQKELSSRGLTPTDMRDSLRRDMLANKVMEREVISKVAVTDEDVKNFFEANRASFNRAEDAYHIAQITVTPTRANQQINRSGNDAGTPQEAQAKAQMLMERLKSGAPFAELAADFSEDPESAQRGGDLGFVPVSALRNVPQPLRDAVMNSQPGAVRMVSIGGGHTIVLLVARDTAGQKDPSMPQVKEMITNTLKGRREQLMRAAYLNALRNDATVVNHLADRIVETQGKVPSLAPGAPGAK
ncbi:MAG: SurA N-terminal domain-containing protein [Vicinamibacterales bacterium]